MRVGFSDNGPALYLVQERAKPNSTESNLFMENHIQGWMNVRESYSRALEEGTLPGIEGGGDGGGGHASRTRKPVILAQDFSIFCAT